MKHFARLNAFGYVGTSPRAAFVFNLTSKKYFDAARKRGKLRGLVALRGFEQFAEDGNDPDAALILGYKLIWPGTLNALYLWNGSAKAFCVQTPNQFGGNQAGIMYQRHKVNTPAQLNSPFAFLANQPFAVRVFLFDPPKVDSPNTQQPRARWRMRFGGGQMRWQFSIIDGQFELARLSEQWSEAKQTQLDTLEDKDEPTLAQQEQIRELRGPIRREAGGVYSENAIFESVDSPSLGSPVKEAQGSFYELCFIPEPRGRLNVILSGSKAEVIDVPQVLAGSKPDIVTGAGPVSIWTSGSSYLLQMGRPAFIPKGDLLIGPFRRTGQQLNSFNTSFSGDSAHRADANSDPYDATLIGTDIVAVATGLDPVTNEAEAAGYFDFITSLTTSDNRFTPFLYSLQVNYEATARPSATDNTVNWSSSNHLDNAGNPPILDVEWSCDGANRRSQATVRIRDVNGAAFAALDGGGTPALENRLASLSYGPSLASQTALIGRGLVKSTQLSNMATASENAPRWIASRANAEVVLTLCDAWDLLEEIPALPIRGDGKRLGAYLRLRLTNCGYDGNSLAGVSENFGRFLPSASLGQSDCVLPSDGQSEGDFLRQMLDRFGHGATLTIDENGVWQLGVRSEALRSVTTYEIGFADPSDPNSGTVEITKTVAMEFSSNAARNDDRTYPGRLAILGPLDFSRDFDEFFNDFVVEGALDPETGQRISARFTNWESVSNPNARNYIGRLKPYQTIRDEGLRSLAEVQLVLRSLVSRYGQSGRFVQFETYFHPWFFPDDRALIDGDAYSIKRINGGSLASDRMTLVAQQL